MVDNLQTSQINHMVVLVGVITLLSNLGLVSWGIWSVRRMIAGELDSAIKNHNSDNIAHMGHPNVQRHRDDYAGLAKIVGDVATRVAVVDERIRQGQEIAAQRWDHLEERLARLDALEQRVTRLEAEHAAMHGGKQHGGGCA